MLSRKRQPDDLMRLKVGFRRAKLSRSGFHRCDGPNRQPSSVYRHGPKRKAGSRTVRMRDLLDLEYNTTCSTLSGAGLTTLGHGSWSGYITSESLLDRLEVRRDEASARPLPCCPMGIEIRKSGITFMHSWIRRSAILSSTRKPTASKPTLLSPRPHLFLTPTSILFQSLLRL